MLVQVLDSTVLGRHLLDLLVVTLAVVLLTKVNCIIRGKVLDLLLQGCVSRVIDNDFGQNLLAVSMVVHPNHCIMLGFLFGT